MDAASLTVGAVAGLIVGCLAGIVLALTRSAKERATAQASEQRAVRAETELQAASTRIGEEKKLLETAEAKFREVFQAVAAESLRNTRDDYLLAAQERVTGLVKPIDDALKLTRDQAEAMDRRRGEAYGSLETQLKVLGEMQEKVQQEARNLSTALRRPFVRGRWGEVTLRNLVETAGMSPYCDFDEQVSVDTDEGRLRPDMTVRLPGDRIIVVDAKLPLESYLDAMEAPDEATARQLLNNHAAQVHSHVVQLSSKRYFDQFRRSPDFVIMFIPGEAFFGAALEADRGLLEFGMSKRVILASPATLMTLLSTINYMWRQAELAENAEKIKDAGQELYTRLRTMVEHMEGIRRGLSTAVKAFDDSVGSMERRVLPSARRLKELGIAGDDIREIEPLNVTLRELPPGEE